MTHFNQTNFILLLSQLMKMLLMLLKGQYHCYHYQKIMIKCCEYAKEMTRKIKSYYFSLFLAFWLVKQHNDPNVHRQTIPHILIFPSVISYSFLYWISNNLIERDSRLTSFYPLISLFDPFGLWLPVLFLGWPLLSSLLANFHILLLQ